MKIKGFKILASPPKRIGPIRFSVAEQFIPTAFIFSNDGDILVSLFLNSKRELSGMWRGQALPWVLEVLKAQEDAGMVQVLCADKKCKRMWKQVKTWREVLSKSA